MFYDPILLMSLTLKIFYSVMALIAALGVLRLLDRLLGIKFVDEVFGRLLPSPVAIAIYFAARFVGVCLLIGMVVS